MERGVLWTYVRRRLVASSALIGAGIIGVLYAFGWLTSLWFSLAE